MNGVAVGGRRADSCTTPRGRSSAVRRDSGGRVPPLLACQELERVQIRRRQAARVDFGLCRRDSRPCSASLCRDCRAPTGYIKAASLRSVCPPGRPTNSSPPPPPSTPLQRRHTLLSLPPAAVYICPCLHLGSSLSLPSSSPRWCHCALPLRRRLSPRSFRFPRRRPCKRSAPLPAPPAPSLRAARRASFVTTRR